MFGALTEKFQAIFSKLGPSRKLTEENITEAIRQVRLALLEADVNYSVAKAFIQSVKEKALGEALLKSVSPGQQFIKIVHDELVALMGGDESKLHLKGKPAVIMLAGLQGSGKTTSAAKLACYLKKNHLCKNPLLAACDLQRPAAIEQLQTLGRENKISVFTLEGESDPLKVAKESYAFAKANGYDLLIVDTAGRLHIDEDLMSELEMISTALKPNEILFVANAATGQDAVNSASEFNKRLEITGSILTMLDGSSRAGAAISIKQVTGKPLKFEGVGEKIEDFQVFNPQSMADRILGMGDTINLVKKAQEHIDEEQAKKLEEKIRKATFTYDDYLKQIQMVKKMGSLKGLLKMMPGMSQLKNIDFDESSFFKTEAMILSMTLKERAGLCEMVPSRRKRIAKGSGTTIDDVNRLVKSFKQAKQFFKNMPNMKNNSMMNNLEKLMGGSRWR